jgi:hypothetical protein
MSNVEFQAKVENGIIVVPKKQTIQLDTMDELAQKPDFSPNL